MPAAAGVLVHITIDRDDCDYNHAAVWIDGGVREMREP